uniref:Peptidase A1 domain-containing protein n=1 Tax=Oryza barthii TaxID=65489 RepID=A0A0D3F491_9ORYZ
MTRLAVRSLVVLFLAVASPFLVAGGGGAKLNASSSSSPLYGIEFPPFNAGVADGGCDGKLMVQGVEEVSRSPSLKLHMTHRSAAEAAAAGRTRKESFLDSAGKDVARIHTMLRRVAGAGGGRAATNSTPRRALAERIVATVESGVAVGSGEYLVDLYVGTPPRRFQMIMDTGSDLNWLQCVALPRLLRAARPGVRPGGLPFLPQRHLRRPPLRPRRAADGAQGVPPPAVRPVPSNTTGDLALEAFTVNLTAPGASRRVDDVVLGCGHSNRGLFHGAAGLLGLGRGALSFASQLRAVYGHAFSYCLVDHGSSVGSKIVFGDDDALLGHPRLNYTAFAPSAAAAADTFYYVQLKGVLVGGEKLNISPSTWDVGKDGSGGTIIDSGTTLSYFAEPAYEVIRRAFVERMDKAYPLVADFPVLSPCYNVSGVERVEVPEFSLLFADGAVWDFPAENYFVRLDPDGIMCLAVLGTPRSAMSIIGNFQQQNFHVLYDLQNNRLGFAPRRCAEV